MGGKVAPMLNERITLSIVALGEDIERRVMMATQLMAAHGVRARVQAWDGTRSSLVIANANDAYGRNALDQVKRRGGNVLAISDRPIPDTPVVASSVQVAELVERIQFAITTGNSSDLMAEVQPEFIAEDQIELDPSQIGGLLQVCLQARRNDVAILATAGPWQILIRREASRIAAGQHSDLLAAQSRLVSENWETRVLTQQETLGLKMEVTQSLDAFLITGSDAIANDLPLLPGNTYQLSNWPDLGSLPKHQAALRLASALVKQRWSIKELAIHCAVTQARANAFCWAMLGSGLLQSELAIQSAPPAAAVNASPNILSRLARRFGLLGSERK